MIQLKENSALKEGLVPWSKIFPDVFEYSNFSKKIDVAAFIGSSEKPGNPQPWTVSGGSVQKAVFSNNSILIDFGIHSGDKDLKSERLYLCPKGIYLYRNSDPDNCSVYSDKSIYVHDFIFDSRKSYKGHTKGGTVELSFGQPENMSNVDGSPAVYVDRLTFYLGSSAGNGGF